MHEQLTLPGMPVPPSEPTGFVYFGTRNGFVKIGHSRDPERRAQQLRLNLLLAIPGTRADEKAAHKRFASARIDREWFFPTDTLWRYISSAA